MLSSSLDLNLVISIRCFADDVKQICQNEMHLRGVEGVHKLFFFSLDVQISDVLLSVAVIIRELKQAMFVSRGPQPEVICFPI